jgi:hypothetical protein
VRTSGPEHVGGGFWAWGYSVSIEITLRGRCWWFQRTGRHHTRLVTAEKKCPNNRLPDNEGDCRGRACVRVSIGRLLEKQRTHGGCSHRVVPSLVLLACHVTARPRGHEKASRSQSGLGSNTSWSRSGRRSLRVRPTSQSHGCTGADTTAPMTEDEFSHVMTLTMTECIVRHRIQLTRIAYQAPVN